VICPALFGKRKMAGIFKIENSWAMFLVDGSRIDNFHYTKLTCKQWWLKGRIDLLDVNIAKQALIGKSIQENGKRR
jgi:hypothetical protein